MFLIYNHRMGWVSYKARGVGYSRNNGSYAICALSAAAVCWCIHELMMRNIHKVPRSHGILLNGRTFFFFLKEQTIDDNNKQTSDFLENKCYKKHGWYHLAFFLKRKKQFSLLFLLFFFILCRFYSVSVFFYSSFSYSIPCTSFCSFFFSLSLSFKITPFLKRYLLYSTAWIHVSYENLIKFWRVWTLKSKNPGFNSTRVIFRLKNRAWVCVLIYFILLNDCKFQEKKKEVIAVKNLYSKKYLLYHYPLSLLLQPCQRWNRINRCNDYPSIL